LGSLEAYPNGDAVKYADVTGLDAGRLHNMGRYALRWPGHSRLWKLLTDLHLMDDEPVFVDGQPIDRRGFLAAAMEPHIRLADNECDLETGLTAMSRTVGFPASIGAQMIGTGRITKRGILSPVTDVPYETVREELAQRGIQMDVSAGEIAGS